MYRSMWQVADDLKRHDRLIEVDEPVSPTLEIAEIQRRVFLNGGPAVLFTNVQGCSFPMLGNLFGNMDRARFLFRKSWENVRRAIELKVDPNAFWKNPMRYAWAPRVAWTMLPRRVSTGLVLGNETTIDKLPQQVSWPMDGGAFVTLPQVLSAPPGYKRLSEINLGMYRIQLSGNEYLANQEIGLHYQIHRGIGVHHQAAIAANKPFQVNVFVGGSPAMTLSAVMPLPEGMSELTFAGALAGHRIPMIQRAGDAPIYADADFCIVGEVDPHQVKPEGPFGDHLGYYSLQHMFPFMKVKRVYHRRDAVWPFTVVGRPPQEDTMFGEMIHELTGPVVPTLIAGVRAVHAVDEAGVHPLLLAIGSERYMPFKKSNRPQELLTQANAILGQGQLSLAKYLLIVNGNDSPDLDIHNIQDFFQHLLERVDWSCDLHFQTKTTVDTLDYSGDSMNCGSKVVIAARGQRKRELATRIPSTLRMPDSVRQVELVMPGVIAISGVSNQSSEAGEPTSGNGPINILIEHLRSCVCEGVALIVLVDDAKFTAANLRNFLWTTFTRSDPARDIHGVDEFSENKHWGCHGPLVIDARIKPHHAPGLFEDPTVTRKIDAMAAKGLKISRYL